MEHTHWHPSNFDPDPTEEVTDTKQHELASTIWQYLLPDSNKADKAVLSVALRHGISLAYLSRHCVKCGNQLEYSQMARACGVPSLCIPCQISQDTGDSNE